MHCAGIFLALSAVSLASAFAASVQQRSHKPSQYEIKDAYSSPPDDYAPRYDTKSHVPCSYDHKGWLKKAAQHGCPLKVKVPPKSSSHKPPPKAYTPPVKDTPPPSSPPASAYTPPVDDTTTPPTSLSDSPPANAYLPPADDTTTPPSSPPDNAYTPPADDTTPPASSSNSGTTACTPDGGSGRSLISIDLLNCSDLCILSVDCPQVQKQCSIPSYDGVLLNVVALDCSVINILSSS